MQKSGLGQTNNNEISTSIVNFIPLEKIGEGSFSSVYKVRRITDDCIYALKKIKIAALKEKQKQNALNQIRILASLNSQHIVQYRQAFFDHKLNLLCIVLEFANEGDLQKKVEAYRKSMRQIPENEIWRAAYHTIRGLDILHSNGILHRDIKSANIFINDGVYKLGDLNVSKVQDNNNRLAYTQTGTPYYASPEVWRDEPYDSKSDIWSLGCVLYEMCTFRPPFKGKDLESLFQSVQTGFYEPLPIQYSKSLNELIAMCLRLNPKHRHSCKQILSSNLFQKKCYELRLKQESNQIDVQLLKTIKLPSDLKDLKRKLPKSKYSSSIDNITYKSKDKIDPNQDNEFISSIKKYSHHDYYLQLARRKKESHQQNTAKINRVISEGSALGNPEENETSKKQSKGSSVAQMEGSFQKNKRSSKILRVKPVENNLNELGQKLSIPYSDRSTAERQKKQVHESQKLNLPQRKYLLLLKNEESKARKFSHDQESERTNHEVLNNLGLIKKLSQASSVNHCLSQRYLKNELIPGKSPETTNIETSRHEKNEKMLRKLVISKKNEELMEIERKVEQKRKQLRKIGSIQRLQAGSHKNIHNLSYRPTPSTVLQSSIKRSAAYVSSLLLKSPGSTQDETNNINSRAKQKGGSQKRLMVSPPSNVSSTPYMVNIAETPRMKRMLQNLNEAKKTKDPQLKTKIMSTRYLPHC